MDVRSWWVVKGEALKSVNESLKKNGLYLFEKRERIIFIFRTELIEPRTAFPWSFLGHDFVNFRSQPQKRVHGRKLNDDKRLG